MTTSVFTIHRAIGRPITFKGFQAQYILIAGIALIADFLLFILLYCCGVSTWICFSLTAGLGVTALLVIHQYSRKNGPYGALRKMSAKRQSTEPLPVFEIDHDYIISEHGDCTIAYELFKPEFGTLSAAENDTLHQTLAKAIPLLPVGTVLQFQDRYTSQQYRPDRQDTITDSYLAQSSDGHFNEHPYLEHHAYLFITRPFKSLRDLSDPPELQLFTEQCQQLIDGINQTGFVQGRRLTNEELAGTIEQPGIIHSYNQLSAPTAIYEYLPISITNGFQVGDKKMAVYSISDAEQLPAQCSSHIPYADYSTEKTAFPMGFASKLGILLDEEHMVNLVIRLDDPGPTLKKLETRRRRLRSLSAYDRENGVAQADIESFLEENAKGDGRLVSVHLNIIAWTDRPKEYSRLRSKIAGTMSQMGIKPRMETVGALPMLLACQPGNAARLPAYETFHTFVEQAACFVIPESAGRDSISPGGIRLGDRQTGVPINVDISEEPLSKMLIANFNRLVIGPSGSGKTMFCLHLVRCLFEQLAHIVIVDIGNSYKGLTELLGGRYFSYSLENPIGFNPFWLADGERMDVEKREVLKGLLTILWKPGNEQVTRSEYIILSNMLEGYYHYLDEHPQEFPCFDSFYEWLQMYFREHIAEEGISEKNFDFDNFLYVLRPYYHGGEYDYLLNARERLDLLNERLIVFELDAIKDHPILFPVVTMVIMDTYLTKMRKLPGVLKVILMDEAWKAIVKESMGAFIHYLYKTVRKFLGMPILVTQELEDLISSPIIKNTIINMSDTKILMDLGRYVNRFDEIQSLLGLTEKDKTLLLSLNKANQPGSNYKEVFISLGTNHSRVYRMQLSLEEYLVYTTKEPEKMKVHAYTKKYGGIKRGVSVLAADIRSGVVRLLLAFALSSLFVLLPNGRASAQLLDLLDAALKKVLVTADLAVQRLQTQTLVLQNIQKGVENTLQDNMLGEITGWVQQQEQLYADYYQGLWKVRSAFTSYSKVKGLIQQQTQLLRECSQARSMIRQDPHFSPDELAYISKVYDGLLNESSRNVEQLTLVIGNFLTQMDDASRLQTIDETATRIDHQYTRFQSFTAQTTQLSLMRSKEAGDIRKLQTLYGTH